MTELEICKELGVTPTGLRLLALAVANDGEACAVGFNRSSGERARLLRQGLVLPEVRVQLGQEYGTYGITEQGRAKVDEARLLGW